MWVSEEGREDSEEKRIGGCRLYHYCYYYDYYYYIIATIILIYYYYYYCNYSYYIAIICSHFGTRAQVASRALLQEHGVPSAAAGGCVLWVCKLLHAALGWKLQGGSSTEQGFREREEERREEQAFREREEERRGEQAFREREEQSRRAAQDRVESSYQSSYQGSCR